MHLTEVRPGRVANDPRAVLDGTPEMRITLDPKTGQQPDAVLVALAERVIRRPTHGNNDTPLLNIPTSHSHAKNLSTSVPAGQHAKSVVGPPKHPLMVVVPRAGPPPTTT